MDPANSSLESRIFDLHLEEGLREHVGEGRLERVADY